MSIGSTKDRRISATEETLNPKENSQSESNVCVPNFFSKHLYTTHYICICLSHKFGVLAFEKQKLCFCCSWRQINFQRSKKKKAKQVENQNLRRVCVKIAIRSWSWWTGCLLSPPSASHSPAPPQTYVWIYVHRHVHKYIVINGPRSI